MGVIGGKSGWDSNEFSIAVLLAIVVIYDACHVRLRAGHHAAILNDLTESLPESHKARKTLHDISPKRARARSAEAQERALLLETRIGHHKIEILGGVCVGIGVGYCVLQF